MRVDFKSYLFLEGERNSQKIANFSYFLELALPFHKIDKVKNPPSKTRGIQMDFLTLSPPGTNGAVHKRRHQSRGRELPKDDLT